MEKLLEHYYLNVLHKVFTLTRYINYSFFFLLGTSGYLMRNEMETFFPISSDIYYLHNKKSLIEPLKTNVLQILKKSQDIWREHCPSSSPRS